MAFAIHGEKKKNIENKCCIPVQINLFLIFIDLATPQIELMIDYLGRLDVVLQMDGWNGTQINILASHTQKQINHDLPSYHNLPK